MTLWHSGYSTGWHMKNLLFVLVYIDVCRGLRVYACVLCVLPVPDIEENPNEGRCVKRLFIYYKFFKRNLKKRPILFSEKKILFSKMFVEL